MLPVIAVVSSFTEEDGIATSRTLIPVKMGQVMCQFLLPANRLVDIQLSRKGRTSTTAKVNTDSHRSHTTTGTFIDIKSEKEEHYKLSDSVLLQTGSSVPLLINTGV